VTREFVPGIELARGLYDDVVAPLLDDVPHSAALLGWGSDVLGFDTERSTDHGWGPRLQVFVADEADAVGALLDERLPETYRGWPLRFGWDDYAPRRHVEVTELGAWLEQHLGVDARRGLTYAWWLALPQQHLLEVTAGAVYHDGLGELEPLRESLRWYPDDVWLWLLGAQWRRLSQEEHLVGRAAEVGDELGSRILAARLVRDVVRLCFLLERRYAPYAKWLGTAFRELDAHAALAEPLAAALAASEYAAREAALVSAYEEVARRQNALGVADEVEPTARPFHSRPFRVLDAGRYADACFARVRDDWLHSLPPIGAIDQFADSTDVLSYPARARRLALVYEPD